MVFSQCLKKDRWTEVRRETEQGKSNYRTFFFGDKFSEMAQPSTVAVKLLFSVNFFHSFPVSFSSVGILYNVLDYRKLHSATFPISWLNPAAANRGCYVCF